MERYRFWIFLGLAVVFGLALKQVNIEPVSRSVAFGYHDEDPDNSVYEKNTLIAAQESVGGLSPSVHTTGVEAIPEGAKATEAKKKKDDKKKAAKKDDKKKKKKKKKAKKKSEDPNSESTDQDEVAAAEDNTETSPESGGGSGGVIGGSPGPQPAEDDTQKSLEEWERILLARADFKKTTEFINLYLSGLVEADVFYGIADLMLSDTRSEMRVLGVMALGSTPSARSFAALVLVTEAEPSTSPLRLDARAYLDSYASLQHLRVLMSALRTQEQEPIVIMQALHLIRKSAQANLRPVQPRDPQPGEQSQDPVASPNGRYFTSVVTLLASFTSTTMDGDQRAAVDQTLQTVQQLLEAQPS